MEYTFKITALEIDLLGRALGELPFKDVSTLVAKLNLQLAEQQKPKEESVVES